MEENDLPVLGILTDRGTEYCGRAETQDYQLMLAINQIDHTKTKVKSLQTNGICERFHRTILDACEADVYVNFTASHSERIFMTRRAARSSKTMDQLQKELDIWLEYYNTERTHQGKRCKGRTPMQTLLGGKEIWKDKFVDQI